jgi:hypothetical protein
MHTLPIWDHRTLVGHATSAAQAVRTLRRTLQTVPKGWTVSVRLRDTGLINLPAGWVYSVHP